MPRFQIAVGEGGGEGGGVVVGEPAERRGGFTTETQRARSWNSTGNIGTTSSTGNKIWLLEPVSAYGVWRFERACPRCGFLRGAIRRTGYSLPLQDILGQKSEFQEVCGDGCSAQRKKRRQIAGAFELMLFSEFATD